MPTTNKKPMTPKGAKMNQAMNDPMQSISMQKQTQINRSIY